MIKKYKIFGKVIEINNKVSVLDNILNTEMDLYPASEMPVEISINIVDKLPHKSNEYRSPSIHSTFDGGFGYKTMHAEVLFNTTNGLEVFVKPTINESKIAKMRSIDFSTSVTRFGMVLHELVLVPLMYFIDSRALIHASALVGPSNKAILFGGTGGVGKTSLEIHFCNKLNYKFIADDISIIDNVGYIHPNLSWPKIYAYNVNGDIELEKKLLGDKGFLDKRMWKYKIKSSGPDKVRRRLKPTHFGAVQEKVEIGRYYFLSKSNVNEISINKIEIFDAVEMTVDIIMSEYSVFNNQLYWHEYNSRLANSKPVLSMNSVKQNWKDTLTETLRRVDCYVINIPLVIDHAEFLTVLGNLISGEE